MLILDRIHTLSPELCIIKSEENSVICSASSQESVKVNNCNYYEEIDHLENSLKGTFCFSTTLVKDGLKKINGDVLDIYLLNINGNKILKIYSSLNPNYMFFIGLMEEEVENSTENEEIEEQESSETRYEKRLGFVEMALTRKEIMESRGYK